MTPERGALIPQFRQKAQPVTCLPDNSSPGALPCHHHICPFSSTPAAGHGRGIRSSP